MSTPGSQFLIIGGGVIGLTIARELHKKGAASITLIEKGTCGQEASWAAAGMLGPQPEADEGGAFFDLMNASRDMYPEFAASLAAETGIDVELDRAGTLYLAFSDEDVRHLRVRYEWQQRAGLAVQLLSADETRRTEPFVSPAVKEALYFPKDWQVENRKLVIALKRYADLNNIRIIENTAVERLSVEADRVIGAETADDTFIADNTIIATGAWTSLIKVGLVDMPIRVEPVRGQIVAFQTAKRLFEHVVYSRSGYIVPRMDGRILAGSTTENVGFNTGTTAEGAGLLREAASQIAPSIASLTVADHWAGLRPYAIDGLPVIGSITGIDGLTLATAHYRNGILLAPVTARTVAKKLLDGVDTPALTAFGPDRFRFAAGSAR